VTVAAIIDTTRALSFELVGQVSDVCDRAETGGGSPIVVLQLTGAGNVEPWPGAVPRSRTCSGRRASRRRAP
jgi:hypothetical protein